MPRSSAEFARVYLLRPERSRWLDGWWLLVHGCLALTIAVLELPGAAAVALLAAVGIHALARRPRSPVLLLYSTDGRWAIPARGQFGLRLGPGTAWASWWVELALQGEGVRARALIVRDQLDAESWRRLQLAVREHGIRTP